MFKEINPHLVQEMIEEGAVNVVDIRDTGSYASVSYTHLTLPTKA